MSEPRDIAEQLVARADEWQRESTFEGVPTGYDRGYTRGDSLLDRKAAAEITCLRAQVATAEAAGMERAAKVAETTFPAGLHVDIIEGRLVISIGISALCFAATRGPYFDDICARTSQDIIVTDQDAFAKEILRELRREEEDGTTLVHLMLDKAAERAVENGAEGIEIPEARS